MQITGTISQVIPTPEVGYQLSKGDYVYTFGMSITAPDGQVYTGEIGSKTALYTLGAGQQITVDISQSSHGPKFKKINPQYANQPPSEATPTQLNANTQAIIEQARGRQATAGEQIMDRMGGPSMPNAPGGAEPPANRPTQQDYEAKERKKVVGMCMHGYIVAEINRRPITEVWDDKDAVQAAWKLANICVDGMGQEVDGEPRF